MKKSDIERQLKKELSAPSDFDAVWNKCTTPAAGEGELVCELVTATAGGHTVAYRNGRRIIAAAVAALFCIVAVICVILYGNSNCGVVAPSVSGYFVIDVNPSVRVDYGGDGVVSSAKGLNGDGERLLEGVAVVGLTYDKAVDAIFDACEARGYFNAERNDNAILVTACRENGEKDEKITAEISKKLTSKFEDKAMKGVVISDVDNGKWQKEADKYGINGQKYELILRYLELGGKLDEKEYATVSIRELYSFISGSDKNSKNL